MQCKICGTNFYVGALYVSTKDKEHLCGRCFYEKSLKDLGAEEKRLTNKKTKEGH